uniref:PABS domain-containing protein n=1 Tax=Leersia perrieri TaxID=77586 RepID=A0A0D9X9V2_9ORYZ
MCACGVIVFGWASNWPTNFGPIDRAAHVRDTEKSPIHNFNRISRRRRRREFRRADDSTPAIGISMAAISPELEGLQYLEPSRFIAFSFPNPSSTMPPTPTPRMRLFRDKPRCLCVGVGGGALLMLIRKGLQCDVLGIEADGVVLDVARSHFGLVEDEFLRVRVGDAIQMIQDFAQQGEPVQLWWILIPLMLIAPPLEMTQESILLAARRILHKKGALILNVIPPAEDGFLYKELIEVLRHVFCELYEINVGNVHFVAHHFNQ